MTTFLIIFYLIGVFGCLIGNFSISYRFKLVKPKNKMRYYLSFLYMIIPILNYILMIELFKYYEYRVNLKQLDEERINRIIKDKLSKVTNWGAD